MADIWYLIFGLCVALALLVLINVAIYVSETARAKKVREDIKMRDLAKFGEKLKKFKGRKHGRNKA